MKVLKNFLMIISFIVIFINSEIITNRKNSNTFKNGIISSEKDNFKKPFIFIEENEIKRADSNNTDSQSGDNTQSFGEWIKSNKATAILLVIAIIILIAVIITIIIFVLKYVQKMKDISIQVNKISFADNRVSNDSEKDVLV